MENNSSANNHELSFALIYQWSRPDQDVELAMQILNCPHIGCERDDDPCAILESEIDRIRCALACHPQTPPTVLAHLALYGNPTVLVRIAENPSTDGDTLRRLAFHHNSMVREAVAQNCNTPKDVLKELAADDCADVRFAIAENAQAPWDILENLTRDENPYVAHRANTTIIRLEASTRGKPRQYEFEFKQQLRRRRASS